MKRLLYIFLTVLLLAGCTRDILEIPQERAEITVDTESPAYYASIQGDDTKSYYGDDLKLHWTANDLVSVFNSSTANQKYVFTGQTGDRGGVLMRAKGSNPSYGGAVAANYAVSPYNGNTTLSKDGVLSLQLPEVQTYAKGSFGPQANTMVSVTESSDDRNFLFKNVGGYFVVKLYGDVTVKSVTLSGNNGEKLAGNAAVTATYGGVPDIEMSAEASESVTLDCGDGVKLGSDASSATEFWFVLPPVQFSEGITILISDVDGQTLRKTARGSNPISRNQITKTEPLSVITKSGAFVRTIGEPEIYDTERITDIIYEKAGDYVGDIPYWLLSTAVGLISRNGDIVLNRIVYTTKDVNGNTVEVSGLVSYPKKKSKFSKIMSVQHATCDYDEAPTLAEVPFEILPALKEGVEIVTLADYLGYGVSRATNRHPYTHSEITGRTCADLITAAGQFITEHEGKTLSSEPTIDLIGYSQGGAATISTLLELEKRVKKNQIGSVYAGAGPYDLHEFFNHVISLGGKEYKYTGYVMFSILGLEYGERLDFNYSKIFKPELVNSETFKNLWSYNPQSWSGKLGYNMKEVFNPVFYDGSDYMSVPDIKAVFDAAKKNSTTSVKPVNASKIKLYHSPGDATVPYSCSLAAKAAWGCELEDLEKTDHVDAAIEFYLKYIFPDLWGLISLFWK